MQVRVGIPRGLFYYRDFPFWRTFLEELGVQVVVSRPTDRSIVEQGTRCLTNEVCLPVKVFCGHVMALEDCDYVLIPSIHSLERKIYNCPKSIGLPDLMKAVIPSPPPVLDPYINLDRGKLRYYAALYNLGLRFVHDPWRIGRAIARATRAQAEFERSNLRSGNGKGDSRTTVAFAAHPYLLHDEYLNHRLVSHLKRMDVEVLFPHMVEPETLRACLLHVIPRAYWTCEDEIVGAGAYFVESPQVDGIISLNAFCCGPDSVMLDHLQGYARKFAKPFVEIVLDEHTAEAGVLTRLEAFLDTVRQRKGERQTVSRPALHGNVTPIRTQKARAVGLPYLGGRPLALSKLVEQSLGVSLVLPPVTARTIELGVRHSPEWVCFPFKVMLGTFIECVQQGADTLVMVTSFNACRMGRYVAVQEQIMRGLGYDFQFFKVSPKHKGALGAIRAIKEFWNDVPWSTAVSFYRLGTAKLRLIDALERTAQKTRAREIDKGDTDRALERAIQDLDRAMTFKDIDRAGRESLETLARIPQHARQPLKVGLVGELYVLIEPFCSMEIERELGRMGVEVTRVRSTFLSEYVRFVGFDTLNDEKKRLRQFTSRYLKRDVGGHCLESLGKKIAWSGECDGIVHLMPFGCMPEVIAENIMLKTKERIPVLTVACDEKLGKAGLVTRLEAFVDLLETRRRSRSGVREMTGQVSRRPAT